MNYSFKNNKGFSLIELLVVISIIGVLATFVMASLSDARDKARNAATIQSVRQAQTALALYYDEHGGYPENNPAAATCLGDYSTSDSCILALTTSASTAGATEVQDFVQEYLGETPFHGHIVGTNGAAQDTVMYGCRSGCHNAYFFIYWLEGENQSCGKMRGQNYLVSSSWELEPAVGQKSSRTILGQSYCLLVVQHESPRTF